MVYNTNITESKKYKYAKDMSMKWVMDKNIISLPGLNVLLLLIIM